MTGRLRGLLVLLLAACAAGAVLMVGTASPAAACDCGIVAATTGDEATRVLGDADVVFAGRVVDRRDPLAGGLTGADEATLTFAVDTVYKGTATPVTLLAASWPGHPPAPGGTTGGGGVVTGAAILVAGSLAVGTAAVLARARRRFPGPE